MRRLASLVPILLAGCSREDPGPATFHVRQVDPQGGKLYLNQAITVYFSAPVDWSTLTRDTVRITDSRGQPVDPADGRLDLSDYTVTFRPRPPVTAAMDDGTWRPGATYRLHVSGFPSVRSLRSRTGAVLDPPVSIDYGVVDPRSLAGGVPTPFLPVNTGGAGSFQVHREIRVVDEGRVVRVRFTAPLFPPSVRRESFRLIGPDWKEVTIAAAHLLRGRWLDDEHPGCTLDLVLEEPISPDPSRPHLLFPGADEAAVRDYYFHPLSLLPGQKSGLPVQPASEAGSDRLRVEFEKDTDLDAAETMAHDDPRVDGVLRCEAGVLRPVLLAEAGSGALGAFHPLADTVLAPGVPFDPGDGRSLVAAAGDFHFSSFRVPAGVRVEVRGPGPVVLRSQRRFHIEGRFQVVVPAPAAEALEGSEPATSEHWLAARLAAGRAAGSGCILVTSGHVDVLGEITGAGLHCLAGGFLRVAGGASVPELEVAGPDPLPVGGPAHVRRTKLVPGALPAAPMVEVFRAAAVTRTFPFPRPPREDGALVRVGPRPDDPRILVQTAVARPDPARSDHADWPVAAGFTSRRNVALPAGARFARFRITLEVHGGNLAPPALEWLELAPH